MNIYNNGMPRDEYVPSLEPVVRKSRTTDRTLRQVLEKMVEFYGKNVLLFAEGDKNIYAGDLLELLDSDVATSPENASTDDYAWLEEIFDMLYIWDHSFEGSLRIERSLIDAREQIIKEIEKIRKGEQ